jgi:hypothetical protein
MSKSLFVLGARDLEMDAIASMLTDRGERVGYACAPNDRAGGAVQRVVPPTAYRATEVQVDGLTGDLDDFTRIVLVECAGFDVPEDVEVAVIDHHRPGDSGFTRPASEAVEASWPSCWESSSPPSSGSSPRRTTT